jgi:hypothetical protein
MSLMPLAGAVFSRAKPGFNAVASSHTQRQDSALAGAVKLDARPARMSRRRSLASFASDGPGT